MNGFWSKITLKLTLKLSFLLCVASIEEYKLDTFCITGCEMFYEMVALCVTGKVSNYFRHYGHFLEPHIKNYLCARKNT